MCGGGGFWPYTWRQMPKSEYEAETFKAYSQRNLIQLTKTSQSVYSHSHLCQGTTGEIYWMKRETSSASAKIIVRASDPKEQKNFWILCSVKESWDWWWCIQTLPVSDWLRQTVRPKISVKLNGERLQCSRKQYNIRFIHYYENVFDLSRWN